MKFTKKALTGAVAAAALASGAVAPLAQAEISASVGVASSYLWRGADLGVGTPAVSGELMYSHAGAYGGVWVSSGDASNGTEYDLFAGYGMSFGQDDMFSIDVSLWNYIYPSAPGGGGDDFFELSEAVISFGVGPVALTLFENIAGASGYRYLTLGGSFGDFGLTLGYHDSNPFDETLDDSPVHIDFTYAYNDNLSFTLSKFVVDEPDDDRVKVVVSYSLPIGN